MLSFPTPLEWQIFYWNSPRLAARFGPEIQAKLNPPPYLVSLASPQHCPTASRWVATCWLAECALWPFHPIDRCAHFINNLNATERATAIAKAGRCWACFKPTTDPEHHNGQNCTHPRSCSCGATFHQQLLHGEDFVTARRR
jgi:hypothetical protein